VAAAPQHHVWHEHPTVQRSMLMFAKYMRYLFILQHNTGRVITQQRAHLNAYAEQATLTSHVMERLEQENATSVVGYVSLRRRT
jgi:hypothetical protein